jgi:hypothetical protein
LKYFIFSVRILFILTFLLISKIEYAQDLEPRLLSPVPTGGNFAILSYGYSSGNILLDNSLPIKDLKSTTNSIIAGYATSFSLFGKLAKFDAIVPFAFSHFTGIVSGTDSSTTRTGFGDPMLRISLIIAGTGPLPVNEFMKQTPDKFNLGIQFRVRPPLGQYNSEKLLNLGTNRWSFKFGVGASYAITSRLIAEGHIISWVFTENTDFFNANRLKQYPTLAGQIHVAYIFKQGIWLAVSFGASTFGETALNGIYQDNPQNNSRYGAVFAYKINKNNSLKIAYTSGFSTRYGADFSTVLLAYQFVWFKNN